jgi:PleD family two-component response regulator
LISEYSRTTASLGVAFFPPDADTPEDLIRAASLAMARAKELGRGEVIYFDPTMNQTAFPPPV